MTAADGIRVLYSLSEEIMVGRQSEFSQEIADAICERIADGESLRAICAGDDMPNKATVFRWLDRHPEFGDQYARARQAQAETMADDILEIADDGRNDTYMDEDGNERTNHDMVARSKLRVEARKWLASKLLPKKYGDKLAVGGAEDLPPIEMHATIDATALTDEQVRALASIPLPRS